MQKDEEAPPIFAEAEFFAGGPAGGPGGMTMD